MSYGSHSYSDFMDAATGDQFALEIEIEALNDMTASAAFETYRGSVYLETLTIAGRAFSREEIREWLGADQVSAIERSGQDHWDDTASHGAFEAATE